MTVNRSSPDSGLIERDDSSYAVLSHRALTCGRSTRRLSSRRRCSGQRLASQRPRAIRARNRRKRRRRSGRISGRVVAADSGRPVKRARVFVTAVEAPRRPRRAHRRHGAFELTELPAGRYTLTVSKSGFVSLVCMDSARPLQAGTPPQLGDGAAAEGRRVPAAARRRHLRAASWTTTARRCRARTVRVMRYQYLQGDRRLTPAGTGQTDDRGQYRVWGLMPGRSLRERADAAAERRRPRLWSAASAGRRRRRTGRWGRSPVAAVRGGIDPGAAAAAGGGCEPGDVLPEQRRSGTESTHAPTLLPQRDVGQRRARGHGRRQPGSVDINVSLQLVRTLAHRGPRDES